LTAGPTVRQRVACPANQAVAADPSATCSPSARGHASSCRSAGFSRGRPGAIYPLHRGRPCIHRRQVGEGAMADLSVIDRFTETFSHYIDSGFGLLSGEVSFLSSTLVAIDLTLAGLAWSVRADDHILVTLAKKVLYVGAFAFIIGNFKSLADIIFASFS